jgi:hypothetical protein
MIKIELSNATNGIIKKVIDTQFNGADQTVELTTLYEMDDEDPYLRYEKISRFLVQLTKDLALDTGSEHSSVKLKFDISWGDKYNPSIDEVNEHISYLRAEIRDWKLYKKDIETSHNVNIV